MSAFGLRLSTGAVAWVLACGTAPPPREQSIAGAPAPATLPPAAPTDACAPLDGNPPAPLEKAYLGLARQARCEPELQALMREVSGALGVDCSYCHVPGDFAAMTDRKQVSNWMAIELAPSLRRRGGGQVACRDCHAGRAKFLGNPRRRDFAIEWMTLELVERFEEVSGRRLYCKTCHGADLGQPAFRTRLIQSAHLPPKPARAEGPAP